MTSALQKSKCCSATSAAQLSKICSATSVFACGMLPGWGLKGGGLGLAETLEGRPLWFKILMQVNLRNLEKFDAEQLLLLLEGACCVAAVHPGLLQSWMWKELMNSVRVRRSRKSGVFFAHLSQRAAEGGGKLRGGETYRKTPPQKRPWTPPPAIRFPPLFWRLSVISLKIKRRRPDQPQFLRPPRVALESTLCSTPPQIHVIRFAPPPNETE